MSVSRTNWTVAGPNPAASIRTALPNATLPCVGFAGGYRVELEHLSFVGRVGADLDVEAGRKAAED